MTQHPKYLAIAGDGRLEHPAHGEAAIRRAVRHIVSHRPPVLWLASGVGASSQIAVDELLALDQFVRIVLPFAPGFLAKPFPSKCRRTLAEQVALAESLRPVEPRRHEAAARLAKALVVVADLLIVFWHGDLRSPETVAPMVAASYIEVPVHWVRLPRR